MQRKRTLRSRSKSGVSAVDRVNPFENALKMIFGDNKMTRRYFALSLMIMIITLPPVPDATLSWTGDRPSQPARSFDNIPRCEIPITDGAYNPAVLWPPDKTNEPILPYTPIQQNSEDALIDGPPTVIDLMILYTPDARRRALYGDLRGEEAMNVLIDSAVAEAHAIYQNSKINCRLRVVYRGEVNYLESGDMNVDLARLQNPSDGYIDEIHQLRDQYAADIVSLATSYGQFAGIALLMTDPLASYNTEIGFNVLLWYALTDGGAAIFTHELAHNMGCQHARMHAESRGAFDFSYGHNFIAEDGKQYATLESVASGKFILHISNPLVSYRGAPTGVPEGSPDAADNARTIANTAPIVAAYRPVVGAGLIGQYFDNKDQTNLKLTRIDPAIDFDWNKRSPDPTIGSNTFSIIWAGRVEARYSEPYTFHTISNDRVRLWINEELIIDNWVDHADTEDSGTVNLTGGQKYRIRIEYRESRGKAMMKLYWSSPSQMKGIIPRSQLYPN